MNFCNRAFQESRVFSDATWSGLRHTSSNWKLQEYDILKVSKVMMQNMTDLVSGIIVRKTQILKYCAHSELCLCNIVSHACGV